MILSNRITMRIFPRNHFKFFIDFPQLNIINLLRKYKIVYTQRMKYENLTRFDDVEFKRLAGVPRQLFSKMLSILENAEREKRKSGRPHSLSLENQLLLTLNYLRSYRTQIELSADFGLAESNVNRTIQKVENALIHSRQFALPKRNQNLTNEGLVIVDVTESQIERPKKTDKLL